MPNMDGLEAARRALALVAECRMVMLTTFDLDQYVYAARGWRQRLPLQGRHLRVPGHRYSPG